MVLFAVVVTAATYFIARGLSYYFGYDSSGMGLAGMALIISGGMSWASYYWSDKVVLALSGAKLATRKEYFNFYTVCENLCLAAGIPQPKLYVIEDTAMNAFATGRDPQHAAICATNGLLVKLDRTELEGVIGHEISHIVNFDTRLMAVVTVLVGVVTLLGDWLLRASWWGGRSRSDNDKSPLGPIMLVLGLVLALLSPIIAQLIQLAISRRREFLADASSVRMTRQPGGLISALTKLGSDKEPLEVANKATAHLYIVNPLKNRHDAIGWFAGMFATHPPLEERLAALRNMS